MALAGLVWLLLLRSHDASWEGALREHQIQGFNGVMLVGIGLQGAARALTEIVDAAPPFPQVMPVVGWVVLGILLWAFGEKIRPPEDGSPRRR